MTAALGLALLTVAVVLAISGATKVSAPQTTEDAFLALRIPLVPPALGAALLPWAEIALAVGLVALRGLPLVIVAGVALALCLAYTGIIARALGFAEPVTCACFGTFGAAKVSRTTLWRNIVLSLVAALALAGAVAGEHVWGLVTTGPLWILVAALTAVLFALIAAGSESGATSHTTADSGAEELDYERVPIPYGVLQTQDGVSITLREMAAAQARLLIFLSSGCGSCNRTEARVDEWAKQLHPMVSVVPVYAYAPKQTAFGKTWFLQPENNVSTVLDSRGTPSAVLLGADGMLAGGPVAGEDSVRRFVDEVIEQLRGAPELAEIKGTVEA